MGHVPGSAVITFLAANAVWWSAVLILTDAAPRGTVVPPAALEASAVAAATPIGIAGETPTGSTSSAPRAPAVPPVPRAADSRQPAVDVAAGSVAVTRRYTWELVAAGGIIFGRGVQERVERYGDPGRPFAKVRELVRRADLAIATLEAPLSGNANRFCDTCFTFVGHERYVSGIADAGFDALSLAANHIGDAGPKGVTDSIRVLTGAGIVAFGAGANAAEARRPALLRTAGGTVALLGYSDVGPPSYVATATSAGHAPLTHDDGYRQVRADIAAARAVADVVVVVTHWGVEYEDRPRPWIVAAARAMIDAGADVVLGDHPHWVQSVELYGGGYIAYSLGNFVFDQMWSSETREGSIHRLFFDGPRLAAVRIVPTLLEDWHQPRPLSPDERAYSETMGRIWRHSVLDP
jgi:poly-gamma-glutamate capsule biosynthesis protein CapA/YwtB (metallophosphatase superfamily)